MIDKGGRLDFLGSYAADHVDGGLLARELVGKFVFIDDDDRLGRLVMILVTFILMMAPLPY